MQSSQASELARLYSELSKTTDISPRDKIIEEIKLKK